MLPGVNKAHKMIYLQHIWTNYMDNTLIHLDEKIDTFFIPEYLAQSGSQDMASLA